MIFKNRLNRIAHVGEEVLLCVMLLCAHQNALALGLGNAETKTHLGQALHVVIPVSGASEIKGSGCFSVLPNESDPNQLNTAQLSLSDVSKDEALLNVVSYQVMNEPIVNLSIQANCGANIRRDYVILLDPPAVESQADRPVSLVEEDTASVQKIDTNVKKSTKSSRNQQQTEPQAYYENDEKPKKKSKKSKNADGASRRTAPNDVSVGGTKGVADADTGLKLTPKTDARTNNAENTQPRLSISGGGHDALTGSLAFDKQLHFTPETAPLPLGAEIAVQDEATVLTNRLMHLEKQMNVLSLSNKKLRSENAAMSAELSEAKSWNNRFDWLGYIIGGGLLMSSIVLADKWRRQRQLDALEYAELSMQNAVALDEGADLFKEPLEIKHVDHTEAPELVAEVNHEEQLPTIAFNDEPEQAPFLIEDYEESDHNILDHADVFLSHGRTSLAIQLLQNHLLEHPKKSVTVWMFLLDLLAKEHLQTAYEQTARECQEHFNVRIAEFDDNESSDRHTFEDFPRLISGLEQVWGTPAALTYLEELVYNSRLETRVGFEKNVLEELLLLKDIAKLEVDMPPNPILDEKKLAIKAQKEAQLAALKAQKMQQLQEEAALEEAKIKAAQEEAEKEKKEVLFEFSLVEYDKNT
jgi:hypothetical protein